MLRRERFYEQVLRAGRAALRHGWGQPRLARALAGRAAALPHLARWASDARTDAPLVVVHAPSVGEALMAQAIIAALRAARADVQIAFTFFSPSAERVAARVGADVWCYLPWDVQSDVHTLLDVLRPAAISFVRTEIWPVLIDRAAARGIPSLMLNAVLAQGSSRSRAGARYFLGPAYARLHALGAVSDADAVRFLALGVPADRIAVTGDARFDQVWARIQGLDRDSALLARLRTPRPTLVAGSTWPADERVLAGALAQLAAHERPRLIVAPHEPTADHLAGAERAFTGAGMSVQRLAAVERGAALTDVILVDRVGVLADIYSIAQLAYVGGGFGSAGLHSVVEPAALGVPVLYGPHHGNATEAGALAETGGGRIVTAAGLPAALRAWLQDEGARRTAMAAAASFVQGRLGGAAANAALLLDALAARPS